MGVKLTTWPQNWLGWWLLEQVSWGGGRCALWGAAQASGWAWSPVGPGSWISWVRAAWGKDICGVMATFSLLRWIHAPGLPAQPSTFQHGDPEAEPGEGALKAAASPRVPVGCEFALGPHPCSRPPHITLHRRCLRSASATLTCTRFCRAMVPPPIGCCKSCSTW